MGASGGVVMKTGEALAGGQGLKFQWVRTVTCRITEVRAEELGGIARKGAGRSLKTEYDRATATSAII